MINRTYQAFVLIIRMLHAVLKVILKHPVLAEVTNLDINQADDYFGYSPLYQLLQFSRNPQLLDSLLKHGADPNAFVTYEMTPTLVVAVEADSLAVYKNLELVKLLVESGKVDIGMKNKRGETAFHVAVEKGHVEIAEYLIRKGASVNGPVISAENGAMFPLWEAVRNDHVKVVELLIENGANPECEAGIFDSSEFVSYLTSKNKANIDDSGDDGPINYGSFCSCHNDVTFIIPDEGGKPLIGGRCLQPAASLGFVEVMKVLVEKGKADIRVKGPMGQTPFFTATKSNKIMAMEYLHKSGADLNEPDILGRTPLYIASLLNHVKAVKFLLEKGVNVNTQEYQFGLTPLHAAIHEDNEEIVDLLLSSGDKINDQIKDKEGKTAAEVNDSCSANKRRKR